MPEWGAGVFGSMCMQHITLACYMLGTYVQDAELVWPMSGRVSPTRDWSTAGVSHQMYWWSLSGLNVVLIYVIH
jgi:hypothetical protein